MKLSARWIFDHIDAPWNSIPSNDLVESFIKSTAEVEQVHSISCPIKSWYMATASSIFGDMIALIVPELNQTIKLPARPEIQMGMQYLIKKENDIYLWVSMRDVGSAKEGLLPVFSATSSELLGSWRDRFEADDLIITVDNKSINHRPDLWGHRGIAREIVAKHNLKLMPEEQFLAHHEIQRTDAMQAKVGAITLDDQTKNCSRFAAVALSGVVNRLSDFWIVVRLARTEIRSIDAIVDATNYVMLDFGHPLHAFDASAIARNHLRICQAKNEEQLALLDSSTVKLADSDIIIADGEKAVSLAGIMGGSSSAVNVMSTSLLVEAACFNPAVIRTTSGRLGKRTESSSRFEKGLNPAILETVLLRFIKILHDRSIKHTIGSPIVALGALPEKNIITVAHAFIEDRLGVSLDQNFVLRIFKALNFSVTVSSDLYQITVPYERANDIEIPEDIVEEVGRLYGYDQIQPRFARRETKPFSLHAVMRIRQLKRFFSYASKMREVMTYAFFDESFIKKINFEPIKPLQVKEAVSENFRRLVTTLTPNLLARIAQSAEDVPALNIYECARIWPYQETGTVERFVVSGIMADFKNNYDFYAGKAQLESLFDIFGISVTWKKIDQPPHPWYMPYQTAWIFHQEKCIGIAGKANPLFYHKVALGDAFIWEIDADFILSYQQPTHHYQPPSKYPRVHRDISVLIPRLVTVQELLEALRRQDARINDVRLVDFFEKAEWDNKWALTLGITLEDHEKTLTTAEVDAIIKRCMDYLISVGAQIR